MAPPAPPVYKYFFTDLLTNTSLGTLPMYNVQFGSALSSVASFSAAINLSDERFRKKITLSDVIIPQRTAYWIDRNGVLVSGGIVWDDDYDSSTKIYTIAGSTFDSYADFNIIDKVLAYTNLDLCTIAIRLWNDLQSRASANIGLTIPAEGSALSGTTDSENFDPTQLTTYGSAISSMSQQQPGFDYLVDVGYDVNGAPTKTLLLGSPFLGNARGQLTFRYPGNILSYKWPTYGSQSPNDIYGNGGGVSTGGFFTKYTNQSRLNAGYPLQQGTVSYKNVFDQQKLTNLINGYGTAVSSGVTAPTLTLSPNRADTPVGSFDAGDRARIVIEPDERFPNGLDTYMRVATTNVQPASAGQVETVTVTLTQAV